MVHSRVQQKRCRSTAQQTVESDSPEHAHGDRCRIDVCQLSAGIDQGHHEQGDETSGESGKGELHRHSDRAAGAAVMVGEMPSAAWTGRHASGQRGR